MMNPRPSLQFFFKPLTPTIARYRVDWGAVDRAVRAREVGELANAYDVETTKLDEHILNC